MNKLNKKRTIQELTDLGLIEIVSGGISVLNESYNWIEAIIPKKPPTLPLEPIPKN